MFQKTPCILLARGLSGLANTAYRNRSCRAIYYLDFQKNERKRGVFHVHNCSCIICQLGKCDSSCGCIDSCEYSWTEADTFGNNFWNNTIFMARSLFQLCRKLCHGDNIDNELYVLLLMWFRSPIFYSCGRNLCAFGNWTCVKYSLTWHYYFIYFSRIHS